MSIKHYRNEHRNTHEPKKRYFWYVVICNTFFFAVYIKVRIEIRFTFYLRENKEKEKKI